MICMWDYLWRLVCLFVFGLDFICIFEYLYVNEEIFGWFEVVSQVNICLLVFVGCEEVVVLLNIVFFLWVQIVICFIIGCGSCVIGIIFCLLVSEVQDI